MLDELRQIEHVCLRESLLHLIELVSTHRVDIPSAELVFVLTDIMVVIHVSKFAQQVILQKSVIGFILQMIQGARLHVVRLIVSELCLILLIKSKLYHFVF